MIVTFASVFLLIPYDITFLYRIEDYYPFTAFHMVLLGAGKAYRCLYFLLFCRAVRFHLPLQISFAWLMW